SPLFCEREPSVIGSRCKKEDIGKPILIAGSCRPLLFNKFEKYKWRDAAAL
ncbi:MAG: hypothetical protein ACJASZ_001321, partial [Yoonia sp.]